MGLSSECSKVFCSVVAKLVSEDRVGALEEVDGSRCNMAVLVRVGEAGGSHQ